MALSPQWLDELRARITLSSVIQRTTKLQRAGGEWKACCPFHNEKTPSFTVSDQKGFYHCFGCGAHGDAIRWMTDQRGLSFMDAVKELAAEAGMEVPAPDPRAARAAEQRAGLHDVMQAAQDWFVANLRGADGAKARDYLETRGFDAHTLERFGFGYAPDNRNALKQALSQFEERMLIEGGLRIDVEGRDPYDRFRDRLMLPIQDTRGRVIGFGGRILDKTKTDAPKYLNSPDTPLFDKGRTLFNLHRAAQPARQSGRIVVVEGYMDVIALAAAGIGEAVAPMGTALTERQLELLWRVTDKPVLCFDGDAAGQRAAMRAITRALPLLQPGRTLQFLQLPPGLDPDDLIRRDGKQAMERLLSEPQGLLDTLWRQERDASPLNSPEEKAGLKARLMDHVDSIAHPDIAALYRRELLDRFSAFAFPPRERKPFQPRQGGGTFPKGKGNRWGQLTIGQLSPENAARLKRAASGGSRDLLTQAVLAGLLRHPGEIPRHAEALLALAPTDAKLAQEIEQLIDWAEELEANGGNPISAPGNLAPPPDNTRFSFLMEGSDPQAARDDLAEAVSLLVERPALEAAIAAATARFETDPEGAFEEQQALRKRKLAFESRLGQMARKRASFVAQKDDPPSPDTADWGEQEAG
ncbi:DNA primase [Altererythrobacter atlanticus]|uniref:DNA primase n=1 Tax=Croceibacterium atlanticum TaxID=1267766 RepID=A0A0F7KPI9_9SPHN|nr:DNA primase [Croceibacterium atlanticum]AKH41479.1 DNA primase [Croceibacterium atlanticum]MBB5732941.1 DNA primase [Croceibacterium atlanticum]